MHELTSRPYELAQPSPQPEQQPARRPRARAGQLGAALAPSTLVALARWWHADGAAHSMGDAVGTIALAIVVQSAGAVMTGIAEPDSLESAVACALVVGGVATAAMVPAAYADQLALPVIVCALATLMVWLVVGRMTRTDRTAQARRDHETARDQLAADTVVRVEQIHATRDAYAQSLADAWRHRLDRPAELTAESLALPVEAHNHQEADRA